MSSFATPTPLEWREAAQKALKERPIESLLHLDADQLVTRPLYAGATGVHPVFAPRPSDAEGRAWDLRTQVEGDDAEAVNDAILTDLQEGAASVLLSGGVLADAATLERALDGVALELAPVALDAGFAGVDAADALAAVAKGSPRAMLRFHLDPISAFAQAGGSPCGIDDDLNAAAKAALRHAGVYPDASLFLASGRVAHEAGGSAAQELAFAASSAVAYVKAVVAAGLSVEAALKGVVVGVSVDQEYFDALAKVRAMRLIWANLSRAFGVETQAIIEARSSRRMLSARDPWPNLLRLTAAGFAGAVGGADVVVLDGFTRATGRPDAFARRQARNTQLVLMEEANLGRVDDPAAGSWYLDARTHDLAQAGWTEFQTIEAEGGIIEALKGGVIQPRIARARAVREAALKNGAAQIIGVTKFVDPEPRQAPVESDRPSGVLGERTRNPGQHFDPLGSGFSAAPSPEMTDRVEPLTPIRFAAAFEEAGQ
ncbi:methylmalonyl-CoA mutase [Brevundimonas nasdae]|uniref:methylmalonyl-CoA mutase family protein n=1 Tax=Brevundimonas nasdae TaxID=172043 RepID=UPI0019142B64|nr:methylmalonyl-CoA mutase family protein [Brevundimonas nasdae]MBK6023972.1 methylmalonyl-CoA mutase [Brevundimonas nasdae]MDQ0450627.1 methylmalonyl-CoA mutase [Brevundimonas nasdae]